MSWRAAWKRRRDLNQELNLANGRVAMLRIQLRSVEEARDAARRERDAADAAAKVLGEELRARDTRLRRITAALADAGLDDATAAQRVRQMLVEGPEVTGRG